MAEGTAAGRAAGRADAASFGAGRGIRIDLDKAAIAAMFASPDGPTAKAVLTAGQTVERRAKQNAPVKTGRLRSSITKALYRDGAGFVCRVGTNVSYAKHVEMGTSRMAPRAYLRRALHSLGGAN